MGVGGSGGRFWLFFNGRATVGTGVVEHATLKIKLVTSIKKSF